MPTREYRCRICRQHFEVQTTGADEAARISCPKCRSTEIDSAKEPEGLPAVCFPSLGGRFT